MGSFIVTGGPVLVSCKTPLTRKALSRLYFRKTKPEEHIVSNLFGYTSPTAKRRMHPCCSIHLEQSFYWWLLNSRGPLQWRCLKDLVVILLSLQTNRNKLKGSADFIWNTVQAKYNESARTVARSSCAARTHKQQKEVELRFIREEVPNARSSKSYLQEAAWSYESYCKLQITKRSLQ